MSDLTPTQTPSSTRLSRAEKAAVVVRFLLSQGAELNLNEMPHDLQARLTQQMGGMRYIDRRTLAAVMTEFAQELENVGLSFPTGLAQAIAALDGKISPLTAARLRKEAGVKQAGDPWARIGGLELGELAEIAERESIQVAAVLVSKLPVSKAAGLLGQLEGPLARRITLAIGKTAAISPDAVERIGVSLATQLDDLPDRAFEQTPDARVGAILNQTPSRIREEVLAGLKEADQDFAQDVARNVFTFAHISARVAARDVPAVLRAVDQEQLKTALVGVTEAPDVATRDFLFDNLPKRLAEGIREEMDEMDAPTPEAAEQAMADLVGAIQQLAETGDIKLADLPPVA